MLEKLNVPCTVFDLNVSSLQNEFKIYESAIMSVESVESLNLFNSKAVLSVEYPRDMQFYVHFTQATLEDVNHSLLRNFMTSSQCFLIENETQITLNAFVLMPHHCSDHLLTEINSFNKKTLKWQNSKFSVDNFQTFHGCEIILRAVRPFGVLAFKIIRYDHARGSYIFNGYLHDIFVALAGNLNFTYKWKVWYKENGPRLPNLKPEIYIELAPYDQ